MVEFKSGAVEGVELLADLPELEKSNEEFGKKFNLKTNYTSHIIQDELINKCADVVKEIIVKDIEDVEVFGIMCDKARYYKQEQMALCVRYVKNLDVVERFLGFIDCSMNQDAESLYQYILWYLKKCKLSSKPQIVAQSYDGANVMSGKFNGLQNKIKSQYPYAIYTHCMAHKMNLIVLDMCKYVKETRHVFNTLESLYIHFSHPSKNQKLIEIQTKLGIKCTSMIRLSDTRWNCRYRNIESVKASYKAIIQALEEEIENEDDRGVNEAIGILTNLKSGQFIVYLFILHKVLININIVANKFQEKTATLGESKNIIQEIFAKDNGISIQTPSEGCKRKRQEPHNLKHFDTAATTSAEQNINDTSETIEDYFRKNAFFPVFDTILINLEKRFSAENLQMATAVDQFIQLNFEESQIFVDHYKDLMNVSKEVLQSEIEVAKNCILQSTDKKSITLNHVKKVLTKQNFPNLYKLFQVALTIPISSSTCERSFSAMHRIKTWLRTSMLQERFNNTSILYIEKEIYKSIDTETIINIFAQNNRYIQLN
ncbi:hypothetical protein QTP88_004124 [Uroleucon formosanum]